MASAKTSDITLGHIRLVMVSNRVRSNRDRRVWVYRETHSYVGSDSYEYRKAFETKAKQGARVTVPETGTHASINAKEYQW